MSVPFGVGRETLSQQLSRIEASRPARRDTSGVVVIDDALRVMLAGQPIPAFRGLTASDDPDARWIVRSNHAKARLRSVLAERNLWGTLG